MIVIRARNVHQALPIALSALDKVGVERDSRNGPVVMFREPVTTVYEHPEERVVFWPERDANPFFHLFESLWMLGGKNDVESVARYVERMRSYSDGGTVLRGAYGWRWLRHFGFNQLTTIVKTLKENKDDRRQVLSMWDASFDLGIESKDIPCNLQAIFQIACDGRLDMTVTNRSNDIVWGAYGANAVHFSYLHEYVARSVGVRQGIYRQVSANFHAYKDTLQQVQSVAKERIDRGDHYTAGVVIPYPLMSVEPEVWEEDLSMFLDDPQTIGFRDPFFRRVASPMVAAHTALKTREPDRFERARDCLVRVAATDWRLAALEWVGRRERNWEIRKARAMDDGVFYEE